MPGTLGRLPWKIRERPGRAISKHPALGAEAEVRQRGLLLPLLRSCLPPCCGRRRSLPSGRGGKLFWRAVPFARKTSSITVSPVLPLPHHPFLAHLSVPVLHLLHHLSSAVPLLLSIFPIPPAALLLLSNLSHFILIPSHTSFLIQQHDISI